MIRKPFAFRTGPCAQNIGIIMLQHDDVGIYPTILNTHRLRIVLHRSKSIPKWLRKKYIIMSSRFFFYFIGTYILLYFILIHGYCCFLWRILQWQRGIRDSLDRIVDFFSPPCRNLSFSHCVCDGLGAAVKNRCKKIIGV